MSASLIGHFESSAFRLSTVAVSMSLAVAVVASLLKAKAPSRWFL